ncbi:MAG: wax ester/triacylglycerol synthase domain-containing protein [Candidatus Nanopelagicales bacterium]
MGEAERMRAFDAVMWGIEADPALRSVVVSLALLATEPDLDLLTDRIMRMTVAAPRLRQRLVGNPLALRAIRWDDDPDFDLGYHVRRYHVAADGTLGPVLTVAQQLLESDFDWDRPLWEAAVVTGFDGTRSALIMKLHHAVAEGLGGVAAAESLFDRSPAPDPDVSGLPAEVVGSAGKVSGLTEWGLHTAGEALASTQVAAQNALGLLKRIVRHPRESVRAGTRYANSTTKLLAPVSEPLSPLLQGRSARANLEVLTFPLETFEAVAAQTGHSRDELLLAAVAGGMRSFHEANRTAAEQIRISLPIRVAGTKTTPNRWVAARFPIPIDSPDARARIEALAPVVTAARNEPALSLSDTIYRLLAVLPQKVTTSITVGMMKGADLAVTDVPGPAQRLYAGGAEVISLIMFEPRAGAAANISLVDYEGVGYVGINGDARALPDLREFSEHLTHGFDEVLALADGHAHSITELSLVELPEAHEPQPQPGQSQSGQP